MDYQTAVLLVLGLLLLFSLLTIGGLVLSARAFNQLVELTKLLSRLVVSNTKHIRTLEKRSDKQDSRTGQRVDAKPSESEKDSRGL
jgi:biopolymer transport protein ExbB/TolQ